MQLRVMLISAAAVAALAACDQQAAAPSNTQTTAPAATPATPPAAKAEPEKVIDTSKVLIHVNDDAVTLKALEHFMAQLGRPIHPDPDRAKDLALTEMVKRLLLAQYAKDNHLDEELDVYLTLQRQEEQVLIAAARRAILKDAPPITDEELKERYEKECAEAHKFEYQVQHILVESQEEADKLIADLGKGADFTELAKKHYKGTSREQGGELGWVREGQVVPEFFAAMSNLEKGKYTKVPVRTQFGWHVIRVNDIHKLKTLPFEKVREQVLQAVQAERVEEKISELRSKAKVQMN